MRPKIACKHEWMIASPNGETSVGVCRLCGQIKEFSNVMPKKPGKRCQLAQLHKGTGRFEPY